MPFSLNLLYNNAKKLGGFATIGAVWGYSTGYCLGELTVKFLTGTLVGEILNYATGLEETFTELTVYPTSWNFQERDRYDYSRGYYNRLSLYTCFGVAGAVIGGVAVFGKALASVIEEDEGEQKLQVVMEEEKARETPFANRLQKINFPDEKIPRILRCPISKEIMEEPMFFKEDSGTTYDKVYIEHWLAIRRLAPHTNQILAEGKYSLFANGGKKREIEAFVSTQERIFKKRQERKEGECKETRTESGAEVSMQNESSSPAKFTAT